MEQSTPIELTEQSKKVIHIMLACFNPIPIIRNQPEDVKIRYVIEALKINGITTDQKDITNIAIAIAQESTSTIKNQFDMIKNLKLDWKSIDFKSMFFKK